MRNLHVVLKQSKLAAVLLICLLAQFNSSAMPLIIAYYATSRGFSPANVRLSMLDQINLANAQPQSDGSLKQLSLEDGQPFRTDSLLSFVDRVHQQGVACFITIGGGKEFAQSISDDSLRSKLVDAIAFYANQHHFDGVDIDYESWWDRQMISLATQQENYNAFIELLRNRLPSSLKLSAAVNGTPNFYNSILMNKIFDQINIMSYDYKTPNHAPYITYVSNLNAWETSGVARAKLFGGVPFYGRTAKNRTNKGLAASIGYRQIISQNANFASQDSCNCHKDGLVYYDSKKNVAEKADYALRNRYGGVMVWELTLDTENVQTSLLAALNKTLHRK